MIENNVEETVSNKDKKNRNYYLSRFMGIGLILGIAFDQLTIGLCLGVAVGLMLDYKKKK